MGTHASKWTHYRRIVGAYSPDFIAGYDAFFASCDEHNIPPPECDGHASQSAGTHGSGEQDRQRRNMKYFRDWFPDASRRLVAAQSTTVAAATSQPKPVITADKKMEQRIKRETQKIESEWSKHAPHHKGKSCSACQSILRDHIARFHTGMTSAIPKEGCGLCAAIAAMRGS
jgi:hypothetical protein